MRQLILFFMIPLALFATLDLKEKEDIDSKIEGIANALIPPAPAFKNPFITVDKALPRASSKYRSANRELVLNSIIANSAQISGRWYKVDDKVDNWRLNAIFLDFVVLRDGEREIRLAMDAKRYKNNNIKRVSGQ